MPRGARDGNSNAAKHFGRATKSDQIATRAASHKRRLLRQIGTRESALSPSARGYLALLARLLAKLDTVDAYLDEAGLIRSDGEPQPVLKLYVSLANSARLTMQRLEEHLRALPEGESLSDYLARAYGADGES
jgi:hypothetical protein